ncbi:hypothetical protein Tco_0654241 [Tanacetum coccineum]|uniref:Uncharacterized protein n=1 Tax=Tanacetum coccineum TaxID=301880 RepID=A0ABQ4X2V5_9ASTR
MGYKMIKLLLDSKFISAANEYLLVILEWDVYTAVGSWNSSTTWLLEQELREHGLLSIRPAIYVGRSQGCGLFLDSGLCLEQILTDPQQECCYISMVGTYFLAMQKQTRVATSKYEGRRICCAASCCGHLLWIQNQIIQVQVLVVLWRFDKDLGESLRRVIDVLESNPVTYIVHSLVGHVVRQCKVSTAGQSLYRYRDVEEKYRQGKCIFFLMMLMGIDSLLIRAIFDAITAYGVNEGDLTEPSPSTTIPDSIPESSGGNLGVEKKYPLRKKVLLQMLELKLESEEDSTMDLECLDLSRDTCRLEPKDWMEMRRIS